MRGKCNYEVIFIFIHYLSKVYGQYDFLNKQMLLFSKEALN